MQLLVPQEGLQGQKAPGSEGIKYVAPESGGKNMIHSPNFDEWGLFCSVKSLRESPFLYYLIIKS